MRQVGRIDQPAKIIAARHILDQCFELALADAVHNKHAPFAAHKRFVQFGIKLAFCVNVGHLTNSNFPHNARRLRICRSGAGEPSI